MADRTEIRLQLLVGLMRSLPPSRLMNGTGDEAISARVSALEKIVLDSESGEKSTPRKRGPGRSLKNVESDKDGNPLTE